MGRPSWAVSVLNVGRSSWAVRVLNVGRSSRAVSMLNVGRSSRAVRVLNVGRSSRAVRVLNVWRSSRAVRVLNVGRSSRAVSVLNAGRSSWAVRILNVGRSSRAVSVLNVGRSSRDVSVLNVGRSSRAVRLPHHLSLSEANDQHARDRAHELTVRESMPTLLGGNEQQSISLVNKSRASDRASLVRLRPEPFLREKYKNLRLSFRSPGNAKPTDEVRIRRNIAKAKRRRSVPSNATERAAPQHPGNVTRLVSTLRPLPNVA